MDVTWLLFLTGFETARALAFHGAHVIMACRDMNTAGKAAKAIKLERPHAKVETSYIDLANLHSVQQFAINYKSRNW